MKECRMCGVRTPEAELDGSGVCDDCNYDDQEDETAEATEVLSEDIPTED